MIISWLIYCTIVLQDMSLWGTEQSAPGICLYSSLKLCEFINTSANFLFKILGSNRFNSEFTKLQKEEITLILYNLF